MFGDVQANYTITANPDGSISVAHVTVSDGLGVLDGVDQVRNVEILRFADGDLSLVKPVVDLHAFDVGGTFADTFASGAYNLSTGTTPWNTVWSETGDDNSATAAAGQIQITGGNLRFDTGDGATITRTVPLAGAASARAYLRSQRAEPRCGRQHRGAVLLERHNLDDGGHDRRKYRQHHAQHRPERAFHLRPLPFAL